jgi:beta-glucosidase
VGFVTQQEYPFQDASLDVEQRVLDLLSRMTVEDKAGLMFHPIGTVGGLDDPGTFRPVTTRQLLDSRITHMNVMMAPTARGLAEWNNLIQQEALRRPLGIPITISTDPRHSFTNNPATSFFAGPFSQWPEPLGFGAIGSEELVERFAHVVREEYLAVGIRAALHPQIDLATEPRWGRQMTTFGEDADLVSRLGVAYVQGLQGHAIGPASVSAMAKHFPGGGPQKDGEDPHFAYGRERVYPGGKFDLHLEPFKAVIAAGVSQLMPYYGMPVGTDLEEVGFSFNKQVITGLLREQLGYDGIGCTDWGVLSYTCWGVEELTFEERMIKALDAGIDQFGGETTPEVLVSLVRSGAVAEARLDVSVCRLLREKFRLGLFENPFVDAERADSAVGTASTRAEGVAAQAAAHTLLKNAPSGPAQLPLRPGLKVYVENLAVEALGDRAQLVASPEEADVAVLRLEAPYEKRGEPNTIESFFRAGSLAFPAGELERICAIAAAVPTVVDVYLDRPAILAELSEFAASLVVNFGASEEAFVNVLFGDAAPQGRLPFDIPSSMKAVEQSDSDAPFDTADPTFRFGFGLSYTTPAS